MFVTPIIKSGPEINAFAFKTVNFTSTMINSVLEIMDSTPDMIDFGFQMVNCELEMIISGVHMFIVKPSITISVLVAVFLRTEIIIDAIVAVFSMAIQVQSLHRLTEAPDCSGLFHDRSGLCLSP